MRPGFIIRPEAEGDIAEAYEWYEKGARDDPPVCMPSVIHAAGSGARDAPQIALPPHVTLKVRTGMRNSV